MSLPKLKRTTQAKPTRQELPDLLKTSFADEHPTLAAMLTQTRWEDGSQRRTSTVLFFVEEGALRVCLNDREAGQSCFLTVGGVKEALEALEAGLVEDNLTWRRHRQ